MAFIFPVETEDQRSIVACGVAFSLMPFISVILRVVARRKTNRSLEASDWLIICACLVTVVYQGVAISSLFVGGLGFHVSEIIHRFGVERGPEIFLMHLVAIQILWAISLGLCKISILLLCSRVFVNSKFIITAKAAAVLILLWTLTTILNTFFMCKPFAFNWDTSIPGGSCGNSTVAWMIMDSLNILTDWIVLLLPMPHLFGLKMPLYKKFMVAAMFGVGLLTCIISILSILSYQQVKFEDVTFTIPHTILYSAMEPCLAITLACVPTLRPLFRNSQQQTATGSSAYGLTSSAYALDKSKQRTRSEPLGYRDDDYDDSISEINLRRADKIHDYRLTMSKAMKADSMRSFRMSVEAELERGSHSTALKEWAVKKEPSEGVL